MESDELGPLPNFAELSAEQTKQEFVEERQRCNALEKDLFKA